MAETRPGHRLRDVQPILDWDDRAPACCRRRRAGATLLQSVKPRNKWRARDEATPTAATTTCFRRRRRSTDRNQVGKLRMKGKEVFRHAVTNLADVLTRRWPPPANEAGEVDWVVPHQANKRILDATAKKLGLDPNRVV
jgi:3-oxoacyl-[acyl-carrier-protein] synthase-3